MAAVASAAFLERHVVSGLAATTTTTTAAADPSSIASSNICGARYLGGSDLIVSEACLGTMTFGVQNTQHDALEQFDYAISRCGVNFIDTAELYPVPMTAKEWRPGTTEEMVGNYIHKIGVAQRQNLVLATKIAGYGLNSRIAAERTVPPLSLSPPYPDCRLDDASVKIACDASLRRLQTDYIDLMQIHWPDRYIPVFGQTTFRHDLRRDDSVPIEETAAALRDLIEDGKIRYIGLSNETPFGVCEWIKATEKLGIRDKLVSIQNSYSLVDRRFDGDLAEVCDNYKLGLLPWSVLAGGLLSGKYRKGQKEPPSSNSRFIKYPEYMRRWSPTTASTPCLDAVDEYAKIATQAGMTPAELAIAFVRSRRFISEYGSTIIAATTMEQLQANLAQFDGDAVKLSQDILDAIDKVHMKCRDPSCSL